MGVIRVSSQMHCAATMQFQMFAPSFAGLPQRCVRGVAPLGVSSPQYSKFVTPVGLAGVGLGNMPRRTGPVSTFMSAAQSRLSPHRETTSARAAAAAAVEILLGEPLLEDIAAQDLEMETPSLVANCSDLDWEKLAHDLRVEAFDSIKSAGVKNSSLNCLDSLMQSWLHDSMWEGIENPSGEVSTVGTSDWNFEAAADDLRLQAKAQAAQEFVKALDITFDWERAAAELHQRVRESNAQTVGAENTRPEQRLWDAWIHHTHVENLTEDALQDVTYKTSTDVHLLEERRETADELQAEVLGSCDSNSTGREDNRLAVEAVVAGLLWEGMAIHDAAAAESGGNISFESNIDSLEAASRAPGWLVPTVLAFPVVSYLLFNIYREKVNPYARVTDWMFGVVAIVIVSNLVMMATWGVRLY